MVMLRRSKAASLWALCHFLLPPVFGKSVYCRQLMSWRKVCIANGHLDVLMAGKLLYCSQIDTGHHEARYVRMSKDVPGMAVVLEHLLRDVAGNVHDGLIACATLGKVGNQRVPVVVPTAFHLGISAHVVPCGLERGDGTRGITWTRLSEGEDIQLRAGLSEGCKDYASMECVGVFSL